ncbi:MAG TPA: hypothetical protein VJ184_12630, partial [Chryseolinea sp.]|nr:hypothetical protein [Chryseolinea sp.]
LIDGVERSTDYFTPLLLLILYMPSFSFTNYYFGILVAYLSISISFLVYTIFSTLKIYWVWLNLRT